MAIRRPSIYSSTWNFQDNLYLDDGVEQNRFITVRNDGVVYNRRSQLYDYSNPPYPNVEQRGGSIVAQLDYTKAGFVITIDSWSVNYQDEWPLRLAVNYLTQCLYPPVNNYVCRVGKEDYAFWVSEGFGPNDNLDSNAQYLGREDDFRVLPTPSYLYFPAPNYDNLEFTQSLRNQI